MAADVLVVASKVRKLIKDNGGFNTSGETFSALSEVVKEVCEVAIQKAESDKRKTVMARDVEAAMNSLKSGSGE
jgi:histone H3/H4